MDLPRGPPARPRHPPEEHPLKADASAQLALLDLQQLDSRIDLLRHRLGHLPETVRLDELARQRVDLDGRTRDAQILVDDLTREQKKADADVEQVKTRLVRDQERMDKGLVSNPKDLARMQQELVSLARRISDLEDAELEVMEELEATSRNRQLLGDELSTLDAEIAELTTTRDAAAGDVTEELGRLTADREKAAADIPDALLALYEKVRAQKGGVGAAPLRVRQCGGCSLELTASDLGAIAKAPPDEVLRCEECNRILVRTGEPGT